MSKFIVGNLIKKKKKPFRIWLVEGKTPLTGKWTPVFHFGKSNKDTPRIVWARYNTKKQAEIAATFMQENNSINTDAEHPIVVYRAARYQRVKF